MKKPLSYNLTIENHKALKKMGESVGSASFWLDKHLTSFFNKDLEVQPESFIASAAVTKPKAKSKAFKPPTFNEVQTYCNERMNFVDPQAFIDHYTVNNWFRGKAKIKDWKACVRTWEKNAKPKLSNQYSKVTEENINTLGEWINE